MSRALKGISEGRMMWLTVFISFCILVLCLFFWIVFYKKPQKNAKDGSVTYVCSECGSRHCNCYKEDHLSSKE
ncbi:Uncharacterized protein dnm_041545 [Desulfonema magnum]|uniref:Uncharacterized protein n=1 Tax=Desulfonema magnum TaxID=45655 RepID=A0A975BLX1_9BACT|nr:Uncharacterized protein dnm_041545 [Desulfonema magnum]